MREEENDQTDATVSIYKGSTRKSAFKFSNCSENDKENSMSCTCRVIIANSSMYFEGKKSTSILLFGMVETKVTGGIKAMHHYFFLLLEISFSSKY